MKHFLRSKNQGCKHGIILFKRNCALDVFHLGSQEKNLDTPLAPNHKLRLDDGDLDNPNLYKI